MQASLFICVGYPVEAAIWRVCAGHEPLQVMQLGVPEDNRNGRKRVRTLAQQPIPAG